MPNKSFKNTWLGTTTIKNDQNDLGTQITNNWNNTAKLNTSNIITNSGASFVFKNNNNGDSYFEWRKANNDRYIYAGVPSADSSLYEINNNADNIKFSTKNNKQVVVDSQKLNVTANNGIVECKHLQMGNGSSNAWITPEDNSTKTLFFGKTNNGRFNLDLENNTRINNIPNQTKQDIVNGVYQRLSGTFGKNNTGETVLATNIPFDKIVSIFFQRKRGDGNWFSFHSGVDIGVQIYQNGNQIKAYTIAKTGTGNNDLTNEFRWVILRLV